MSFEFKFFLRILIKNAYVSIVFPFLVLLALISRIFPKRKVIGLGPEPLINNIYHKLALEKYGFKAETFVTDTYFITNSFDVVLNFPLRGLFSLVRSFYAYQCIYMYFNGSLFFKNTFLQSAEPLLFKIAGVKTVLMPYGGDVQELSRTENLLFKSAMSKDYPMFRFQKTSIFNQIEGWQKYADFVFSGCEWVDYMTYWDKLMLAHFSINTDQIEPKYYEISENPIKLLHAPNHKNIKGSDFFQKAIEELKKEGFNIEYEEIRGLPNVEVQKKISKCDIVLDQLIIGWYAMTALQAMSYGKPVVCFLRKDLEELYIHEGILEQDELPHINATYKTIKDKLRHILSNKELISSIGKKSRLFVEKHHSIKSVGKAFAEANKTLRLKA